MSLNNFSTSKNSTKPTVPADKTVDTPAKPEVRPDVKPGAGSPAAR